MLQRAHLTRAVALALQGHSGSSFETQQAGFQSASSPICFQAPVINAPPSVWRRSFICGGSGCPEQR